MQVSKHSPTSWLETANVTPTEKRILELKYSAVCFGKMEQPILRQVAGRFLLAVGVVTGWQTPSTAPLFKDMKDSPTAVSVLVDQLMKFLVEKYPTVNINEVDYAFRNYPVKEWGKQMNLVIIDEVLSQYMNDRLNASAVESARPVDESKQLTAPDMTDDEKIQFARWTYLNLHQVEMIYNCYEVLRRLERMPKPTKEEVARYRTETQARMLELQKEKITYFKDVDVPAWREAYLKKLAIRNYFQNNP